MDTNSKLIKAIVTTAFITAFLLMIPLIAMQFTDEVVWTLGDFAVAGSLLFGTGLAYSLITMKADNSAYRTAAGAALASSLFLIWVNLAVGLIGSEDNPANLMYFGVVLIGLIGGFISRFRPQAMTGVMFSMAFAIALIAGIALSIGMQQYPHSPVYEILGVNGFFVVLFLGSGLLFRRAAVKTSPSKDHGKDQY